MRLVLETSKTQCRGAAGTRLARGITLAALSVVILATIVACGSPEDITDPATAGGRSGPLDAIVGFSATPISDTKIDLTWTDTEGELAYELEWALAADGYAAADRRTLGADSTDHSVIDLTPGEEYAFRLRAYNSDGGTAWVEVIETADALLWTPVGMEGFASGDLRNFRVGRASDGTVVVTYIDEFAGLGEVRYYDEDAQAWLSLTTYPRPDYYDSEIGAASTLGTDILFSTALVGLPSPFDMAYFDEVAGTFTSFGDILTMPDATGFGRPVDLEIYVNAGGINYAVQSFPDSATAGLPTAYRINLDTADPPTEPWQQLGGAEASSTPTNGVTRLAVDEVGGRVALGYGPIDAVSGNMTPAVSMFNGTSWTDLGVPSFYDTDNYSLNAFDVGFNANGDVLVVFSYYDNVALTEGTGIYEYDGADWIDHGGFGTGVWDIILERDPEGVLYVAYRQHDRITVRRWDETGFVTTGSLGKNGYDIDLDVSSVPTVVFHDYSFNGPTVYELD